MPHTSLNFFIASTLVTVNSQQSSSSDDEIEVSELFQTAEQRSIKQRQVVDTTNDEIEVSELRPVKRRHVQVIDLTNDDIL